MPPAIFEKSMKVRYGPGFGRAPGETGASGAPGGLSFAAAGYAPALALRAADPAALQTLAGEAMGTTWSVRLSNPRFAPLAPAGAAIAGALALVVRQMSTWEFESDISRFNRAPAGSWHRLPEEFMAVLKCAQAWARASGGAFDPTVGPLVDLWGFGPRAQPLEPHAGMVPDALALAAMRARVGFDRIALRPGECQAQQPGGARLDLSGIAKGYSVDLVVQALRAQGFTDFLVEVGGELRACGMRPGGQPWSVGVAGMEGAIQRTLPLRDQAIATSGDHWNAFDHAGRRYSHTLDPRTGEPVSHALSSVTVLHAECMQADALATVLTVLGPAQGLAFATEHQLAALLCERTPQGPVFSMTPAFEALE